MKTGFIFLLLFFSLSTTILAQVLYSDSLALVDLYNSTNGNSWKNNNNWLLKKVATWNGVTVNANRITNLNLSGNKLSGSLPSSFCTLTQLQYLNFSNNNLSGNLPLYFDSLTALNSIDLRNNKFTGAIPSTIINFPLLADLYINNNQFDQLPDLSSLTEFSNLLVQKNKFTFEDLEPNTGIANFQYAPQDSINTPKDTVVDIKDTVTFLVVCGGNGNQYQWTKDGSPLVNDTHFNGANTPLLTINKIGLSDEAVFSCIVTNSLLPGLSLIRKAITVHVNDTRLPQIISLIPGVINYCGDVPVKIVASNSSTLPLSFFITKGNALMNVDTLVPLTPGKIRLRIYNDGDDNYKPVSKDSVIAIHYPANASMEITKIIPGQTGEQLTLSVPYQNNIDFLWINSQGDSIYNNVYNKNKIDEKDEGVYRIIAGSNNCSFFSDSVLVEFSSLHAMVVYELISPNGDGKNDFFYIQNIEKYPVNDVRIFNVWNQLVYSKNNYTNDWSGENLPAGTYYYIVEIPTLGKQLRGSLYLKK
jgi:gliding motility-associated-like protein